MAASAVENQSFLQSVESQAGVVSVDSDQKQQEQLFTKENVDVQNENLIVTVVDDDTTTDSVTDSDTDTDTDDKKRIDALETVGHHASNIILLSYSIVYLFFKVWVIRLVFCRHSLLKASFFQRK